MAEIPIERRKKKSVWPWIIGLMVVMLLIWLLADNNVVVEDSTAYDENQTDRYYGTDRPAEGFQAQVGEGRVQEFVQYVEERNGEISKSHEFTSQGLIYLANALDELYNRLGPDAERSVNTDDLRNKAQQLRQDTRSQQHSNLIRDAFMTAANSLQNLQANFFPNLDKETNNLVEKAREIEGNELATEQGEKIDDFFEMAANAVDDMSNEVARGGDTREPVRDIGPGMLN